MVELVLFFIVGFSISKILTTLPPKMLYIRAGYGFDFYNPSLILNTSYTRMVSSSARALAKSKITPIVITRSTC